MKSIMKSIELTYRDLLNVELNNLYNAIEKMVQVTLPSTPLARPKLFHIYDGIVWPRITEKNIRWTVMVIDDDGYFLRDGLGRCYDIVEKILSKTKGQPREILRVIRRIQAATAWCLARAEGRQRAAQEILKQQSKAVEVLKVEATLNELSK